MHTGLPNYFFREEALHVVLHSIPKTLGDVFFLLSHVNAI